MRAIEDALEVLNALNSQGKIEYADYSNLYDTIAMIETEPMRHGHWDCKGFEPVRCSVCGITVDAINGIPWAIKGFKFCPHCGAKMDEVEDETD